MLIDLTNIVIQHGRIQNRILGMHIPEKPLHKRRDLPRRLPQQFFIIIVQYISPAASTMCLVPVLRLAPPHALPLLPTLALVLILVIPVAGIGKYRCEDIFQAELSVEYWPLENRLDAGSRGCSDGDGEYFGGVWRGLAPRTPRRAIVRGECWQGRYRPMTAAGRRTRGVWGGVTSRGMLLIIWTPV